MGKLDPCIGGRRWNQTAGCQDQNEQDCKANSCFLLSPLLIFLPRAEDGAPRVNRSCCLPARSTAGWSPVQGQPTRAARPLQSLQHSPASLRALLVTHSTYCSKYVVGGLLVKWSLRSVERTDKRLFGKSYLPPSSHQFHPGVKTPLFHQLEPTPKTSGCRSWRDHLLFNSCWFFVTPTQTDIITAQKPVRGEPVSIPPLAEQKQRPPPLDFVQSTKKWIGKRRSFPREKDIELQVQGAPAGSKCSSPEKCCFKVTSGKGCN